MSRPCPVRIVSQNTQDNLGGSDQRSSGWVMGIVRYLEPSSLADSPNFPAKLEVIQNDIIGVSIQNSKNSFGKTCNVSLKSTDFWYPSMVSPGDWIFIWMQDNKQDLDRIISALNSVKNGKSVANTLCNDRSGLKFAGRCLGVTHSDSVASNGFRQINQSISAQSFIEFGTSVYYTAAIRSFETDILANSPGGTGGAASGATTALKAFIEGVQLKGLDDVLFNLAVKYKEYYAKGSGEFNPDVIISLFFILIMGIDRDNYTKIIGQNGTFNNGIHVPSQVATIFNKPGARKIWQIMNVYLGIQQYKKSSRDWYKSFSPIFETVDSDVFKKTPARCKGFVPFAPTLWDNISMWEILSSYLNPVCNEMYTSLRINSDNRIVPTLIIREKPFSTGLYNRLTEGFGPGFQTEDTKINKSTTSEMEELSQPLPGEKPSSNLSLSFDTAEAKELSKGLLNNIADSFKAVTDKSINTRTLYGTLPRWIISESIVRSFTYSSNESARINFVQVWGRSSGAEWAGSNINQDVFRQQQFNSGNFYVDQKDISRNGLRAYIVTSPYDVIYGGELSSLAKVWARLNADWLFNGQLKANGSITVNGIVDPICEGDNLEYRGILFHIEGVTHTGRLDANGQKIWTTTMQLSNGVMASSLNSPNSVPSYPAHMGSSGIITRDQFKWPLTPGVTEVQQRTGDSSKNNLGDTLNQISKPWKGTL